MSSSALPSEGPHGHLVYPVGGIVRRVKTNRRWTTLKFVDSQCPIGSAWQLSPFGRDAHGGSRVDETRARLTRLYLGSLAISNVFYRRGRVCGSD